MQRFVPYLVRLLARLFTVFVIGCFLLLLGGEMVNPHAGPPTTLREWAGMVLLMTSILSLLVAWKWELPGAAVSLATLTAFVFVVGMNRYDVVAIASIPGLLFLADWMLRQGGPHQAGQ